MADYYPLIAKAVSGLEKSTGEARRALYDRARTALLAQLRGVEPALSEPDITRERLALEEAIRKVEAEAARRSRNDPLPAMRGDDRRDSLQESPADGHADSVPDAASPLPRYDLRVSRQTIVAPVDGDDDRPDSDGARQAVPLSAAAAKPIAESRQAEEPRSRPPRGLGGDAQRTERTRRSPGAGPSLSDEGLKGFRDVIAETETLGSATAEAAKNVRAYQAATNPDFERLESRADGRMDARGESEPAFPLPRRSPRDGQQPAGRESPAEPTRRVEARESNRGRAVGPVRTSARRQEAPFEQEADEPLEQDAGPDFESPVRSDYATRSPSSIMRQEDVGGRIHPMPRVARAERVSEREPEHQLTPAAWSAPRRLNKIIAFALAAVLVLAIAGAAYWWGGDIVASIRGSSGAVRSADQAAPAPESSARGKIVERAPSAVGSSEGALVAQKVVLYEEDQTNPNGTQYVGSAVWRTERVPSAAGQKPDLVVRAEIEIPEQKVSVRWSLRRNEDKQLPASHTVEVVFTLPPDFPHGGIANIPGVLMKQGETTRGIPLNGVAVKVTTNFFLIGLSSVDVDMQRNIQLLKERSWFDIPVVYGDGKRAIIAIEKGTPGERAFTEAFAAWGQ